MLRKSTLLAVCLAVALCAVWLPVLVSASGSLNCFFQAASSCPAGSVKLMGVKNDSGGWSNAHAQNFTLNTYANSICCNTTNSSININTSCNMGSVVARLYSEDNSHVQTGNNTDYAYRVCLNTSYQNVTCTYPAAACGGSQTCVFTMASSESGSSGFNDTNAHVGNCSAYSNRVCCGFANSAPSTPTLTYPVNGNLSVFERNVNFTWTAATDAEGNSITYSVNATCGGSCTCGSINFGGLTGLNYTYSSALCVDVPYNWTVTACDTYNSCTTSSRSNFTIASVLDFTLIVNATSFGQMALGQNNATVGNSPPPLVGRNNGNVLLNATINASAPFSSVAMNTDNFMFLAGNNESGSIVSGCSQTTFNNMSTTHKNIICNMSYTDTSDEARIDLNITVPPSEGPGTKTSIMEIVVVKSE